MPTGRHLRTVLAGAFLGAGATAYLAPAGAPFAYAGVFAVHLLFYALASLRSPPDAVAQLRGFDEELAMWRLFER